MIQDHARAKDPLQVPDRPLYFTQQSKENSFSDSTLQLIFKKMSFVGISLVVQQLRLPTSTAQGTGLMPGQELRGLPQELSSKKSACNTGDAGLIPGLARSP